MIRITTTSRAVNLPRPDTSGLMKRVELVATAQFGPLHFGIHKPLDVTDGFAVTELSTRSCCAYGLTQKAALDALVVVMRRMPTFSFLGWLEGVPQQEQQSTAMFRLVPENTGAENVESPKPTATLGG